MLWAVVPEATIKKDCQTLFWKNKVWFAICRIIATPSGEFLRTQNTYEGNLC